MVKLTDGSHGGDKPSKPTEVKTSSVDVEKISARAAAAKAREYPNFPSSSTGGVMPMSIRSRFEHERQRLSEDFTDKWRKWRAQWVKDQTLHPSEPIHVEALERELYNPIRRAYRAPWNWFERKLTNYVSHHRANVIRRTITYGIGVYGITFWLYYMAKYKQRTWEDGSRSAWPMLIFAREKVLPGDPAYPSVGYKFKKQEFADLGFSERKALRFKEPNENK